jgi:hypothetical protein
MPFLSHARDMVIRDHAGTMLYKEPIEDECLERDAGTTGMHKWNKGWRLKGGITSEEREDIWQDLQEDRRAGDRKANSWDFH